MPRRTAWVAKRYSSGHWALIGNPPVILQCQEACLSHDTLVHHAIRPLVRRLGHTSLHPNHVTAARIATAVAAALCFAWATAGMRDVGCALFAASALLDRIDGELARQTGRFTLWGHRLDLVGDCGADALVFLGLGYGSWSTILGIGAPLLGFSAAVGVVALFWQLNLRQAAAEPRRRRRSFDPDDAMFLVPMLVIAAGPLPVIVLAGSVTPLVAGYAIWQRITL